MWFGFLAEVQSVRVWERATLTHTHTVSPPVVNSDLCYIYIRSWQNQCTCHKVAHFDLNLGEWEFCLCFFLQRSFFLPLTLSLCLYFGSSTLSSKPNKLKHLTQPRWGQNITHDRRKYIFLSHWIWRKICPSKSKQPHKQTLQTKYFLFIFWPIPEKSSQIFPNKKCCSKSAQSILFLRWNSKTSEKSGPAC